MAEVTLTLRDTPTYTPRLGSLAGRALEFFRRNPHEELTPSDMAEKFSVEYDSVAQGLKPAVDAGLLVKVKSEPSRRVVYRLTDLITEVTTQ
jgi:DNA-binding MarR family transcriptional regulator